MKPVRAFFALLLLFSAHLAFAQADYAITVKGDTLKGEIKILSYDLLDRVLVVANGKKHTFTALQVREFTQANQIYRPIKRENSFRFMKLVKPGYLSLYAFRLDNQNSYDGSFLVKRDASSMEVPNLTFKKSMGAFLGDCPAVSTRVKNGEFGKRDIDQIIDTYNACIDQKSKEIMANMPPPVTQQSVSKLASLEAFVKQVEGAPDFTSKKDALDLLKDIHTKVSRNEAIPNYLTEGLKSYLAGQPSLTESMEKTIALLKN